MSSKLPRNHPCYTPPASERKSRAPYRLELDDLVVKKGEGMRGLVDAIDRGLLGGGIKIQPGTYRVVIERVSKDALTRKLEALVEDIRSAPPKGGV